MTIIDRYLLLSFAKSLAICFFSLTGLYLVIDAFSNLDEFLLYSERGDGLLRVLAEYYGARILAFFDLTSSVLALIAAIFTLTWLQRHNEMTALLAAGIPKSRLIRPLIGGVLAVSLLAIANREIVIPQFQDRLTRNAQDWYGDHGQSLEGRRDHETQIFMEGRSTFANESRILAPRFRLPPGLRPFGKQIVAANAYYQAPQEGRPGGYLFRDVHQPQNIGKLPSIGWQGKTMVFSPCDTPWLAPNECFVVSNVTFAQLKGGRSWQRFSSTADLASGLRNPSLQYGVDIRMAIHERIVRPCLDMTLIFLGLPLVLHRENRNFFIAIGSCVMLVIVFFLVVIVCHGLGRQYLLTPAFSAWLPLAIFVPLAAILSGPLSE